MEFAQLQEVANATMDGMETIVLFAHCCHPAATSLLLWFLVLAETGPATIPLIKSTVSIYITKIEGGGGRRISKSEFGNILLMNFKIFPSRISEIRQSHQYSCIWEIRMHSLNLGTWMPRTEKIHSWTKPAKMWLDMTSSTSTKFYHQEVGTVLVWLWRMKSLSFIKLVVLLTLQLVCDK